jgi:hypothetical protein
MLAAFESLPIQGSPSGQCHNDKMLITTGETALAAVAVAGLSIVQTMRNGSRATRTAREERIWQKRADIYVDLLRWTNTLQLLSKRVPEHEKDIPNFAFEDFELISLQAQVSAFGSSLMNTTVDSILPPWNNLRLAWGDLDEVRKAGADGAAIRQSFANNKPEQRISKYSKEVEEWAEKVMNLVRTELQVQAHESRRGTRIRLAIAEGRDASRKAKRDLFGQEP